MGAKNFTIKDIADGLKKGEFSAEEIFTHYQNKIKKENKTLNAYLSVFDKHDANIQMHTNDANILAGVPCAIKDNLLIDGTIATAGSKILKNYVSSYNATVIKKLRTAGVNFLGKTNLDEFAMGSSTENSAFGPTKNPLDLSRVPGGSSGGSAAVVAADLAVFALGSDTGGSIRQPARRAFRFCLESFPYSLNFLTSKVPVFIPFLFEISFPLNKLTFTSDLLSLQS